MEASVLVGTFPTSSVANFRYAQGPGVLVFSDSVHADGDLTRVRENDEAWENRGDNALVYDDGYERHWDAWVGPKKTSLFSVPLTKDASGQQWRLGGQFVNLLLNTGHVRQSNPCPSLSNVGS